MQAVDSDVHIVAAYQCLCGKADSVEVMPGEEPIRIPCPDCNDTGFIIVDPKLQEYVDGYFKLLLGDKYAG